MTATQMPCRASPVLVLRALHLTTRPHLSRCQRGYRMTIDRPGRCYWLWQEAMAHARLLEQHGDQSYPRHGGPQLLNETLFSSLSQTRTALAAWSVDDNAARPHLQLGWQTPTAFASTSPRAGP